MKRMRKEFLGDSTFSSTILRLKVIERSKNDSQNLAY